MPWSVQARDGKYCVVKEGESEPVPGGCHSSRTDAIKHQRALYANESRMASVYDELDALPTEPVYVPPPPAVEIPQLRIVVGEEQQALTASLVEGLEVMGRRIDNSDEINKSLVAALEQQSRTLGELARAAPVVHVAAPEVHVEAQPAPVVNVESPRVDVHVPEQAAPQVHVTVEPAKPAEPKRKRPRRINIERDLATGRVTAAVEADD